MINREIQDAIKQAISLTASDEFVQNDSFPENIYSRFAKTTLKYSKERSFKRLDTQILTGDNAPIGFSFSPGRTYYYAEFYYVIEGNENLLDSAFDRNFLIANNLQLNKANYNFKALAYREYSEVPIEGNDGLLQILNQKSTAKRVLIEQRLTEYNAQVERTNIEIRQFINPEVEKERHVRQVRKDSLSKLNPF